MTKLSVNINKIALLRNSRGMDVPNVEEFALKCLKLGAHGITLHPRADKRHSLFDDVFKLNELCKSKDSELNVEGYPSVEFIDLIKSVRPMQCTLVPDADDQLTSDHGWDIAGNSIFLKEIVSELRASGVRTSLFIDYDCQHLETIKKLDFDCVEFYTGPFANAYKNNMVDMVFKSYLDSIELSHDLGLLVNAGHDLNLKNLPYFLTARGVSEVSIGHALVAECLDFGLEVVVHKYLRILENSRICI